MPVLDVMTIREMIDAAFGETNSSCPVNFNMLGTILYILARRMELLKRQFKLKIVESTSKSKIPKTPFKLTEIKIHANKSKQFRKSKILASERLPYDRKSTGKHKRFTQRRSRKSSTHRTPTKKHSSEDSSSETFSGDEVIRKKSTIVHKNTNEIYLPDKPLAETCLFGQCETEDYFIQISPGIQRKIGNHYDEKSTSKKCKAGNNLDEISLTGRRKTRKYSNDTLPAQKRDVKYNSLTGGEDHEKYDDIENEKIYLVTRNPSGRDLRESTAILNPVVTQEQFQSLLDKTQVLRRKYGITSTRKAKWDDLRSLRSVSSMMHPGVALNLSKRLDQAEARLERMLDVVAHFAHQIPKIKAIIDDQSFSMDEHKNLKVAGLSSILLPSSISSSKTPEDKRISRQVTIDSPQEHDFVKEMPSIIQSMDIVTQSQFQNQLKMIKDNVYKTIRKAISSINVETCKEALSKHDQNLNKMHKNINSVFQLERAIGGFGKKVAAIDHIINFQMTACQDTLQQMQNDLENGLDKLNEALMSPKEDVAAVAQITEVFNDFKKGLDDTELKQVNLEEEMALYSQILESVEKNMDIVFELKCSRKEMYEVLNKKVSVKSVNGLLTQDLFCAVTADMKTKLETMYISLFLMECDWQKKIEYIHIRNAKLADRIQLKTLKESMRDYITSMNKDTKEMLAIVGPLKRYPTNRTLERDGKCLSCGTPVETVKDELGAKYWKQMIASTSPEAAVNSTKSKNKEEIATICIPRRPIPHPLEQDSYICQHDCGDIVYTKVFDLFIKELKPVHMKPEAKTHEDNVQESIN